MPAEGTRDHWSYCKSVMSKSFFDGHRTHYEEFWARLQPVLLQHGYELRPRYSPNWKPSWHQNKSKKYRKCEDGLIPFAVRLPVLDATRMRDGLRVGLKCVPSSSLEFQIATFLSSPEMQTKNNRTVPIIETFPLSNGDRVLVMPFLRKFNEPFFHCVGEVVEAFRQYLQGLEFMHKHNIAHGDIGPLNIMMDESKIIPGGSHFCRNWTRDGHRRVSWKDRCTVPGVDYYYIDFGFSAFYNDRDTATATNRLGQVQEAPELSEDAPYNPFKLDVYRLGFVFLQEAQMYPALSVFIPLCQKMMLEDTVLRLDASRSLSYFEEIVLGISPKQLKTPIRHQENWSVWHRGSVIERIRGFILQFID